ncbi:RecX family transcriptional regulator [uncultured Piscinibacter sp.]|uniref:regulatory protein RecX n=1 Tax=uncultured Piscinibacter sp. TaxID=1131835 RepID=UPI00260C5FAD|nr:RecX family transcriptional regulator [uncultured Piscinibacter sp.]
MKPAPRSLKARALQWLAQREHSRAEMQRKLLPHARALAAQARAGGEGRAAIEAPDPHEVMTRVTEVLDWLEANRYLSQQRFAESRIHARAARHGNLRIQQELAQHGIALDATSAQALQASEFGRAREVWGRKYDAPAADAAGRARQARFLSSRGFSAETVRRVLRAAGAPLDED